MSSQGLSSYPPDDSIGYKVIVTLSITFGLAIITLSMRMYSRIRIVKHVGWDDWAIILATLAGLVNLIFNSLNIHYGGGRHQKYLDKEQIIQTVKYSNLAMLPFIFCTCLTKFSVAFMVLRITTEKWVKYWMLALVLSLFLINGAGVVIILGFCKPASAYWDITIHNAKCWDTEVLTVASNIQGACSVGRVVVYSNEEFGGDSSWNNINTIVWTLLEENIGLTATNLPALGSYRKIFQEKLKTSSSIRYLIRITTSGFKSVNKGYYPSKRSGKNQSSDSQVEMANVDDGRKKSGPQMSPRDGDRSLNKDFINFNTVNIDGSVREAY
ncbi:putative polyketide synthase protein [Botrytis fragariae]|uniref:Putative polyketide synthase protein n=1 Tax=Botrytis fragariae TaxID=1964551 RepID=A0A8H6ENA9_9HELO|nr:putative polyketide synthase protein [Botrytis fragariae]KAF5878444.1 putative polyketide synthase protein [Botrytis fragariae]